MKTWNTVAIVGVGLIGGSIGLALHRRKLAARIIGIGRRSASLAKARQAGAVDETTTDLARGVREAELIVVATPVERVSATVIAAAAACPPCALITDAASTKQTIVTEVTKALSKSAGRLRNVAFVGSHPLAGSEKTGPLAAQAELFADRTVVLTPVNKTPPNALDEVRAFWELLGSKVCCMSPAAHDAAVAVTSHVPHLVAAALAASTPKDLLALVAGGWLDTTRVAAGDVELWRQIVVSNRANVARALADFSKRINTFRRAIAAGDEGPLIELLEAGKRIRDSVGN